MNFGVLVLFCLVRDLRPKGKAWFLSMGSSVGNQVKIPGLSTVRHQTGSPVNTLPLAPAICLLHVPACGITGAVTSEAYDVAKEQSLRMPGLMLACVQLGLANKGRGESRLLMDISHLQPPV